MIVKTVKSSDQYSFDYGINSLLDKGFRLDARTVELGSNDVIYLIAFLSKD